MTRVHKKRVVAEKPTAFAMKKPLELVFERVNLTDGYQKHYSLAMRNLSLSQLLLIAESLAALAALGKQEASLIFLTMKAKAPTVFLKNQLDEIENKYQVGSTWPGRCIL